MFFPDNKESSQHYCAATELHADQKNKQQWFSHTFEDVFGLNKQGQNLANKWNNLSSVNMQINIFRNMFIY